VVSVSETTEKGRGAKEADTEKKRKEEWSRLIDGSEFAPDTKKREVGVGR